jgi:hypothetical protein
MLLKMPRWLSYSMVTTARVMIVLCMSLRCGGVMTCRCECYTHASYIASEGAAERLGETIMRTVRSGWEVFGHVEDDVIVSR